VNLENEQNSYDHEQTQGHRKMGLILIASALVLLIVIGAGSFYYNGMRADRSSFALGCPKVFKEINANFNEYRDSTGKPNIDFGSGSNASASVITVRNDLFRFRNLANSTSRYSGSKKALETLSKLDSDLTSFSKIKEVQLGIESQNPYAMDLSASLSIYQSNIYRALTDPDFDRRAKKLVLDAEKKYEAYNKSKYPKNLQKDISDQAAVVTSTILSLADFCRAAR
jgi:hypothetical protein